MCNCRALWLILSLFAAVLSWGSPASAQHLDTTQLPRGTAPDPIPLPHFPDRLHALVFRNWNVVDVDRIAKVVGATPQQILAIGLSMGLPAPQTIPEEYRQRMYLSLIRRNWHLLPYEQLLELLQMSPDELAFVLREDDFLFIKLGQCKPQCEPIRYAEPTAEVAARAAQIKSTIEASFGAELSQPASPRFQFIRDFTPTQSQGSAPFASSIDPPRLGEHPSRLPERDALVAEPQFATRFIYSYVALFGDPLLHAELDPFPDGLLERLAAVGVNGVWLHVVLRDLAPGGAAFPEFGRDHEIRLANLRKLAQRAARYGIGIYLYQNEPRSMPHAFFAERPDMAGVREGDFTAMCTSNPLVLRWISDSLAYVFNEVPELEGVFTISASENLTNCASHGQQRACPYCRDRSEAEIIAEVNQAIRDGVHRAKPAAKVIVWDWGWNRHGDAADHIAALPADVWLMSVSEWGLPIERGGISSEIGEYSMSAVGPGPRAKNHWRLARQRGLKTIAKVQFNNTWELAAVPYLPVLELVAQHCKNLADERVDGIMMSWSLGGYPSLNLEVANRFNVRPTPDIDAVLGALAAEHYGEGAADARAAWSSFSQAFSEYPYDGSLVYNGPQLLGPSNLLFAQPSGYRASMTGFPYDDLAAWRGHYPSDVFIAQFERVAGGWKTGWEQLRRAVAKAPPQRQFEAEADLRVAEAALLHFESVVHQAKFVDLRDRAQNDAATAESKAAAIAAMKAIAEDEIRVARRMFTLSSSDSRIGFEASNQYLYLPTDLVEKVLNCRWIIDHLP